jgi:hypothetical protein
VPVCEREWPFMPIETNGGERKFAAGANWIGQLEESGHSGLRPSVFDFQVQRTAAVSPYLPMLHHPLMTAISKQAYFHP